MVHHELDYFDNCPLFQVEWMNGMFTDTSTVQVLEQLHELPSCENIYPNVPLTIPFKTSNDFLNFSTPNQYPSKVDKVQSEQSQHSSPDKPELVATGTSEEAGECSTTISPFLNIEWCHKKGKTKPQQFWVYCEGSQQNYAKISLKINELTWGPHSSVMYLASSPSSLVLVENTTLDRVYGAVFDLSLNKSFLGNFKRNDLIPLSFDDLKLRIELVEDSSFPSHPHQGTAAGVVIEQKQATDTHNSFCYFSCFTFKNRSEGWFRLNVSLSYDGCAFVFGQSDVFMFNNPRMKKLKEFRNYTPAQIKLMQIFCLSPNVHDTESWYSHAQQLGLSTDKLDEAFVLFPGTWKRKSSKKLSTPQKKKRKL